MIETRLSHVFLYTFWTSKIINEPGPSDLEIMKYIPPDRIRPLVDTAAIDMAVMVVTTLHRVIIANPSTSPAWPITHVNLRNNITPQMLRRQGIKTPSIQPNET